MTRPSFSEACTRYVHRYTLDHVPNWARWPRADGNYCAPQYRSDREWYDSTLFPGEPGHIGDHKHCFSTKPTWPLGDRLPAPLQ